MGQLRSELGYRDLPHYERLRDALNHVGGAWQAWALALGWSTLCEREGPLPDTQFQQRRLFDDVVAPLLRDDTKTAYFLVDALRLEMAQELV